MRIVVQRVKQASVTIDNKVKSAIGYGFLILVGTCNDDTDEDIEWLTSKIVNLRVMDDEQGVMNRSVLDIGGEILVVSQFTLWASYKKGNRPSYLRAGNPEITKPLYEKFCDVLTQKSGKIVQTGTFGAMMDVALVNDGPVTICMDSKNRE
ncbi:MAG: D-aminoacyl-tRNA deacylase [Bacteroidaceae bacterium]|nr:D-aminoacyl-tRNA deacylase [Bacteroidaceae bacterium]